jgi:hypothetical protein
VLRGIVLVRVETYVDSDGRCEYCGKKDVFCRRCRGLIVNDKCWHTSNGHYCVGCAQEMGWE